MQNWDFFGTKFGLWSHLGPSPKFGTSIERLLVNQIPMITKRNTNTNFWACPCELYNIESGLTKPLIP